MIPRAGKVVRPFYGRLMRQLERNVVKRRSGRSVIPMPGNLLIDDADDPNGFKFRHMTLLCPSSWVRRLPASRRSSHVFPSAAPPYGIDKNIVRRFRWPHCSLEPAVENPANWKSW